MYLVPARRLLVKFLHQLGRNLSAETVESQSTLILSKNGELCPIYGRQFVSSESKHDSNNRVDLYQRLPSIRRPT